MKKYAESSRRTGNKIGLINEKSLNNIFSSIFKTTLDELKNAVCTGGGTKRQDWIRQMKKFREHTRG
jgi:hypothetical protein